MLLGITSGAGFEGLQDGLMMADNGGVEIERAQMGSPQSPAQTPRLKIITEDVLIVVTSTGVMGSLGCGIKGL